MTFREPKGDDVSEWMAQAQSGDDQAWGRLLEHYRPLLRDHAQQSLRAALRARVDESDLIQQTCLSAYRALAEFQGASEPEFRRWLLRILERNILQVVERERLAARRAVDRESPGSGPLRDVADRQTSPGRRAIRGE